MLVLDIKHSLIDVERELQRGGNQRKIRLVGKRIKTKEEGESIFIFLFLFQAEN